MLFVYHNPNNSYLSKKLADFYVKWYFSRDIISFLYNYLWIGSDGINDKFEEIRIVTNNMGPPLLDLANMEDSPSKENFKINRGSGTEYLVVYRPYSPMSYFWMPDRLEYHNYKGIMMMAMRLEAAGWVLDKEQSTSDNMFESVSEKAWNQGSD